MTVTHEMNRRILVVDDTHGIHSSIRHMLGPLSHEPSLERVGTNSEGDDIYRSTTALLPFDVVCVESGAAALTQIINASGADCPFAVVFIGVASGSGWSVRHTIEKYWNRDPALHCVICTENVDKQWDEVLQDLSHPHQVEILRQPFMAIEFQLMARSLIHKWHLEQLTKYNLDELSAAKSHMENIIGSMADTLLVINADMAIGAVNRALVMLLGYTEDELLQESPSKIFGEELAQGSIMETLYCQGSVSNVETTYLAKNGQTIPMSLSGSLMRDENGAIQGLVCVAQDITERKRIEEERRQLNDRLVETSRQLGMADVATSVLHNVGNVLNSINVSVGIMSKTLRQSLVGDVQKISQMLNAHMNELGTYLTQDEKGKQIPGYLAQLAEHLLGEQQTTLRELESLNGSAEHAKQCVAMQQGMVKAGGLQEPVSLAELIEQALTINKTFLEDLSITVNREFVEMPDVLVDKHQALQILVNLVRNSAQAMQTVDQKMLTVRIGPSLNETNMVQLDVKDTGVGIHPDHLTRIFAQGFTTKKDGHGFGLHSGALLAKNMGGSLNVKSEGLGCGAMFILTLPVVGTSSRA